MRPWCLGREDVEGEGAELEQIIGNVFCRAFGNGLCVGEILGVFVNEDVAGIHNRAGDGFADGGNFSAEIGRAFFGEVQRA